VPKIVIYKKRSMDSDITPSGLKFAKPPKMSFEVEAEFDNKILAQVRKDSVLLKEMNEEIGEVYDQTCKSIESKLAAFDKLVAGMLDKGADKDDAQKQLDGLNKSIEKDRDVAEKAGAMAAEKVWKEFQKKRKEYDAYRIKIVVSIVGTLAGLIASVTLMATSPVTGGVSTAAAIVGIVKSGVQIFRELASAWQSVEQAVKLLAVQTAIVEKAAKTMLGRKANEYTAALITQFLGVAEPSIKSIKSHLETVQSKLKGVEIGTHDASIKLNEFLDKQDDLKKEFMKDVDAQLAKHPSPKAKTQGEKIERALDEYLAGSKKDVLKQQGEVETLHARFWDAKVEIDKLEVRVAALVGKRDVDERLLRLFLSLADLPLAITESVTAKTANLAAEMASNLAPWVAELAYDKISDKVLDKTFLDDA
jgi:hypothetical protein